MPQIYISAPVNVTGASATAPTHIASIQLPHAGKWDVTYFVKMSGTPGYAALYGQLGNIVGNTEVSATRGPGVNESSAKGRLTFTSTGAQTLNLRGWGTYQATSGTTGRTGMTAELVVGEVGLTGPQGKTGAQGPAGTNGTNGAPGAKGDQGFAGPKGDAGTNGTNGATGSRGQAGADGRSVTVHVQQRAPINSDGVAGDIWYQY